MSDQNFHSLKRHPQTTENAEENQTKPRDFEKSRETATRTLQVHFFPLTPRKANRLFLLNSFELISSF